MQGSKQASYGRLRAVAGLMKHNIHYRTANYLWSIDRTRVLPVV